MSRVSRCFLAVSSLSSLSKVVSLDRSIYQLGTVFHLPCLYRYPCLRFKHTSREKKNSKTKKSSRPGLPQAKVPEELCQISYNKKYLLQYAPSLREDLSLDNYEEKFTTLLHLEEIQQEDNMRLFDMHKVKFRYDGQFFHLYVPAIDTGDLCVFPDDQIIITHSTNTDIPQQFARVCKESDGLLQLRFSKEFCEQYDRDLPEWNVGFIFNRISIRRCHRAVKTFMKLGTDVLFPNELHLQQPRYRMTSDSEFFDDYLDEQQKTAVKQIVAGESRPMPYILFGPPGTGKTVTIVEAILQIFTKFPGSRILVCAPSNSAVNLLALKLHESGHMNPSLMARHLSKQLLGDIESIPESVSPYSKIVNNMGLTNKYRIVVTTCSSADALRAHTSTDGLYTHVFIDEAGQATEPESLIPATLVSGEDGQIILSGDPHQLGPVIFSSTAEEYGLDVSMLQRLMQLPLYSRNIEVFSEYGSYNPLLVTKLLNNFRSHPTILQPSSEMFYDDELQAEGATATTHSLCNWPELPVQGIPLIFHSVQGTDRIGSHTFSRFNMEEAAAVVKYIEKLFNTIDDLKEEHIGIITPYRMQDFRVRAAISTDMNKFQTQLMPVIQGCVLYHTQVESLQEMIASRLHKKIDVGTVEFFQGQERRIIIISTVRSSEETVGAELSVLGFLNNPRRLNVSLTRAQALLIVIGNSGILSTNQFWRAFIDYCKSLGVYVHHDTCFDINDVEIEK